MLNFIIVKNSSEYDDIQHFLVIKDVYGISYLFKSSAINKQQLYYIFRVDYFI